MAKILVVDDDDAIVDLLRMRLKDLGHTVVVAMDANAGMMAATREKPDLITLDFQMPAGDGAKMYSLLRRNTFTFKTKIIFISGMSALDLEKTAPNDPGVRYLQKPIDMDVLKRLVGELLELLLPTRRRRRNRPSLRPRFQRRRRPTRLRPRPSPLKPRAARSAATSSILIRRIDREAAGFDAPLTCLPPCAIMKCGVEQPGSSQGS